MTSTGICIGLKENSRNSSRVLRPPGGGHTNIFGVEANENGEAQPAKKDHGRNASSILEGTNSQSVPESQPAKAAAAAPPPAPQMSEPPAPAQAKGRVPPGGFSSGLW